jgi:hypothetical protein
VSPLSLLTFFAAAKKVSAPRTGGTLINQYQIKERPKSENKAKDPEQGKTKKP